MNETPINRRILIIDDNHAIHADFHKILTVVADESGLDDLSADLFGDEQKTPKMEGFKLDSAFQGLDGVEKVKEAVKLGRPYAMAFVDVRMPPGIDGIETIAKIWEVYPDLQVVVCTAYSDYSWEDMIAKIGQSDRLVLLKKPFDNTEVLQLAYAMTEKWRLLQASRFKIEDLEHVVASRTKELRASEERFRKLCEFSPFAIFEADRAGRCTYSSPRWTAISGLSSEQNLGEGWNAALHPDDRESLPALWKKTVSSGEVWSQKHRIINLQGELKWISSVATPMISDQGEVTGYVGAVEDITESKRIQKERELMEVQFRQAQKLEAIGQLAAGIAHEINTPTQYIGDNTRFLQDSFGELKALLQGYDLLFESCKAKSFAPELLARVEGVREAADPEYLLREIPIAIAQSLDGVDRISKIVRAMKEFSHPGTEDKTPIDLNRAIESTVTVARAEWKYVAEVKTELASDLPAVPCLPGEINQVILNLLVNAAHAITDVVGDGSQGKGTISISTQLVGESVEVRIQDSGGGIPEKVRSRIFEPFFTTKEVGKGTGQGLALAHAVVVEKHGGTIHFECPEGKGTVFVIRLPLRASQTLKKAA
ncbi:MAG TPA: ATP-binding protein [Verrucomicrobiae bacterium]|jgi:PAS domain S-box-containing protein